MVFYKNKSILKIENLFRLVVFIFIFVLNSKLSDFLK